MTEEWIDQHPNLVLSKNDFIDEGVSGFDGSNVRKGALKRFLELVKIGKIPKGSILVIEQWDRLTRKNPMDAIPIVGDILNAGVEIQTLYPDQRYSQKSATERAYKYRFQQECRIYSIDSLNIRALGLE